MLRWDDWKLGHYAEGHPAQLFNTARDPAESTDLAQSEPEKLREALSHLRGMLDPDATNAQAFADQAKKVAQLGGEHAVLDRGQFDYTPASNG